MKIKQDGKFKEYSCSTCGNIFGQVWPYHGNSVSGAFKYCHQCGHRFENIAKRLCIKISTWIFAALIVGVSGYVIGTGIGIMIRKCIDWSIK